MIINTFKNFQTHALEGRCSIQLSYGTSLNCGAKVVLFVETAKK